MRSLVFALGLVVTGCTSTPSMSSPAPTTCEAAGYLSPTGGMCPKGTCAGTSAAGGLSCCGSECPTCEAKGYASFTDAGTCPAGTCPSYDVTASLACCESATYCGFSNVDATAPLDANVDVTIDSDGAEGGE